jgi:hypothetical protein
VGDVSIHIQLNPLHVVIGEIQTLVAAMRLNSRWASRTTLVRCFFFFLSFFFFFFLFIFFLLFLVGACAFVAIVQRLACNVGFGDVVGKHCSTSVFEGNSINWKYIDFNSNRGLNQASLSVHAAVLGCHSKR